MAHPIRTKSEGSSSAVGSIDVLIIAGLIVTYAAVSGRIDGTPITSPMVFVGAGVILGFFDRFQIGSAESGLADPFIEGIFEVTLVIVLFTDASRIDVRKLRTEFKWPLRMLAVGLPLTILLGSVAALWIFSILSFWEAVVLAVVLAPTDAALGQAVVHSQRVPRYVRQTLNVESGLNDGLALPVLTIALALAGAAAETETVAFWVRFAAREIGVAILIGAIVGYAGGRLILWGRTSGWMNLVFTKLAGLTLALLAFGITDQLGGSGFIAAFIAGAFLGNVARRVCGPIYAFAETEGQLLTLVTFLLFGAIAVEPALDALTWQTVLFALLSLTLVRVIPVAFSLSGSGLKRPTIWFLGWFGPRGLASILFGLLVLEAAGMEGEQEVFHIVAFTVLLSIVLHGVTAAPLAERYGAWVEEMAETESMHELQEAPEMPMRYSRGHHFEPFRPPWSKRESRDP